MYLNYKFGGKVTAFFFFFQDNGNFFITVSITPRMPKTRLILMLASQFIGDRRNEATLICALFEPLNTKC